MKIKKPLIYQLIIVLALSLMIPFQQAHAASLPDIPAKYEKEIQYLIDQKVITGYPDKTFKPNNKITREEVAGILGIILRLDGTKRETKFADVNPKSFGSGYIASAVEKGIISGHADGTFRPKDNITRGQVSILLERAFNITGKELTVFQDVRVTNANLYSAVDAMYSNGIKTSDGTGYFKPNVEINRAEFSVMVARSLNPRFRKDVKVNEYVVNVRSGETLNVRSGPGTGNAVVGKLKRGTKVLASGSNETWEYIKTPTMAGYVNSTYLVKDGEDLTEAEVPKRYIAIDAGHGGHDPGASGFGLVEKKVTLDVAKKVEKALEKRNVKVLMTRTNDTYVGLQERVAIAERAKVDTLVSIHANSFSSSSANGTETYYNLARASTKVNDSKQLATFIQNRLYKALNTTNRGVKTANFAVTRTTFPSTLVELAFISNKQDAQKLGSEQYQQLAADAITAGIIDYYEWKEK